MCGICGYVYDETKEGTPFEDLPADWVCPLCGADKSAFSPEQNQSTPSPIPQPTLNEDMQQLSAGQLSAVCSNLARGCEKQYQHEQAALFQELADFFTAATPAVEDGSLDKLIDLIQHNLREDYPALSSTAQAEADRGSQRICVWGEKVTRILESLLNRYRREGEAFLNDMIRKYGCAPSAVLFM